MRLVLCASISVSLLVVQAALAAADTPIPADKQAKILERMPGADANGDGVLTEGEFAAARRAGRGPEARGPGGPRDGMKLPPFAMMEGPELLKEHPEADTDKDGKLSPEERKAFAASRKQAMDKELLAAHPELDGNKDGVLDPTEMRAGREVAERFMIEKMSKDILARNPAADTDGDGQLSMQEFRAAREKMGRGGPRPVPMGLDWLLENFARVDADGNGQLSKEELTKAREELARMGPGQGLGAGFGPPDGPPPAGAREGKPDRVGKPAKPDRAGKPAKPDRPGRKARPNQPPPPAE